MDIGRSPRHRSGTRAGRVLSIFAVVAALVVVQAWRDGAFRSHDGVRQEIPTVWDAEALEDFELPPAGVDFTVEHIPPEYYYSLRERVIHKTYPVYHPNFEPPGYVDSLRALAPETILDTDTLESAAEWIRAGEVVFHAPQLYFSLDAGFSVAALAEAGVPTDPNGVFPYQQYVVLADGDVRLGAAACANCHTRVMPDGSVLEAVQGDFPLDRILGPILRTAPEEFVAARAREQFGAPWIDHPSQQMLDTLSLERTAELYAAIPAGALLRQGTHPFYPTKVPDLRGIRHQRFLDATGLTRHRSIGDLMRYATFTQFVDHLNRYGDFIPSLGTHVGPLPPADSVRSFDNGPFTVFTDRQAYALAMYLYSLEPLPSPHEYDEETLALGERVFIEEGCVTCHPPPHYTNNELTPALGFEPPDDHYDRYPIFDISVETDPALALYTRRGTGYYKIPSLRGLWYRERLFHDGSLSLEEVFDPARLEDDFVPSGFRGADSSTRAIPGHPFGLDLPAPEKEALIAYLLTL